MDASARTSQAANLVRPRLAVAVVAATAAVTIGLSLCYDYWWLAGRDGEAPGGVRGGHAERPGGGLHRRNAVRHTRRASSLTEGGADERGGDRDDDGGGGAAEAARPTDENNTDARARRATAAAAAGGGEDQAETVVEDGDGEEPWPPWPDSSMPQAVVHRAGQNIVSLLFRVSEDNARRSAYVHRGCACNACGIVPIRGIRYRCANCADFDLCETCESQGLHIKTHIFYKVRVPAPPFGPRQMQPVWYPGDPDACPRSLPRALLVRLSRETGFERQELEAFWEQWSYMANTEWREDPDELGLAMDRKTFERCLVPSGGYRHAAPNLIHDRMFAFYDTNHDDLIGFSEFLHGLSYRKRKDKLRKIFDGYDMDRDGLVSRRDFLRFFRAYYVLYKQMHKDILDGLDDQVLSSVETHQLVNNRQPLSSFFGREGRVPQADLRRMLNGKTINNATGEVSVADAAAGVVHPDRPDMATREDILSRLFTRSDTRLRIASLFEDRFLMGALSDQLQSLRQRGSEGEPGGGGDGGGGGGSSRRPPADDDDDEPSSAADTNYWDALLNPPTSVQDLPSMLLGQRGAAAFDGTTGGGGGGGGGGDNSDDIFVANEDNERMDEAADDWGGVVFIEGLADGAAAAADMAPAGADADAERAAAEAAATEAAATEAAATEAAATEAAATEAAEAADSPRQGQREDGGSGNNNEASTAADGAATASGASAGASAGAGNGHARPTTRRLPTAGQMRAQQEALLRAHMSKRARVTARRKLHNRWMRRLFYLDEEEGATAPEGWHDDGDVLARLGVAAEGTGAGDGDGNEDGIGIGIGIGIGTAGTRAATPPASASAAATTPAWLSASTSAWQSEVPEAERDAGREILYQVMQQAFNELLDILFLRKENLAVAAAESKADRAKYRQLLAFIGPTRDDTPWASGAALAAAVAEAVVEAAQKAEGGEEETEAEAEAETAPAPDDVRDPTLPQFRPNSAAEYEALVRAQTGGAQATAAQGKEGPAPTKDKDPGPAPDVATLVRWKRLEEAEQEAQARGGWGRLSYEEFEAIFKEEEAASNRLDYLGSWIDFCIP